MKKYNKIIKMVILILLIVMIFVLGFTIFNRNINLENNVNNINKNELEGNISFVSNRTDKEEELNLLIKEFEEIHPKVKVNLELIGDAEEILQRKATVGELPDVTLVPAIINASEFDKYFLPLDDLGYNDDKIYNYSVGVSGDGKLYTLTTSITWQGVLYNKEIFKEANIKKIPETNEEFFEACKKIKNIGVTPIALNYKQQWIMNMWLESIPYLLDTNLEGNAIIKSEDILNDQSSVYKSLEFAREIVKNGYCENDLLNYDWQQCKNDIKDKKIAMIIWNSDFKYQLEDMGIPKDEMAMFPIPESKIIKVDGDYKFAVSKNTKYPDVSKEFLKFIFENDRYSKAVNIMSSLKDSEKNIKMLKELEAFDLPIVLQKNVAKNQISSNMAIHNEYDNLRKITKLDGSFAQKYIIASDTQSLSEDINKKWNEYRNKIKLD